MLEDAEVEAVINGRGAGQGGGRKPAGKNWRRERKNQRYGAGGPKHGSRRNDKASTAQSYKDFNPKANRAGVGPNANGGRRGGKKKAQRPGKRRRMASRAGRG